MKKQKLKPGGIRILVVLLSLLVFAFQGYAQEAVTGTVKTADGDPVPGATVVVKGTSKGTVTNGDGNFTIQQPE